jgi:hypothetical protein
MGVSLKPSQAVEGGGLLDDVDVKVVEARFAMFDYNGSQQPVPTIKLSLDVMDGSEPIQQYWSVGKSLDWIPSDDGKELVPIGKATQLVTTSNGMILLASLVNAGFPESKIDEDISVLEGMECHVNRVAAPKREGLNTNNEGKKRDNTILTITKIIKYPWDADTKTKSTTKPRAKASSKSKPKTTTKTDTKTESTTDVNAAAEAFVLEVLSDDETLQNYPDGIPKAKLIPEALARLKSDDPNRAFIVKKVFEDEFLNSGPWTYEGGKVKLG